MINKNRKIILIGGPPTVGKSTIAGLLADKLKLPWISTDQVREVMRLVADRNKLPQLFEPEGYNAERYLTEFSAAEIVDHEYEQAEATWPAIKMLIEEDYTWEDGFIIEGIAILPHLADREFRHDDNVKALFLLDEDVDRIRNVIFRRGLWADADTYPDRVKEKEVEWVRLFNHTLKMEIEKFGSLSVEVKKQNDVLTQVLSSLKI